MSQRAKQIIFIIVSVLWFIGVIAGSIVIVYAPARYEATELSRFQNVGVEGESNIKVTSFNIRCVALEKNKDNGWGNRKHRVIAHMEKLGSDVFGLQEVTPAQLDYITAHLKGYTAVGESRDYRAMFSEKSSILYRTDKFELLETRTFWLSGTPNKVSKIKGAGLARVCTYAVLKDKQTGLIFAAVNTHLDYKSEDIRAKQARALIKEIEDFAIPYFVTGDFNGEKDSQTYAVMTAKLNDSRTVAAQIEDFGFTYHEFGGTAGSDNSEYIDFCFVSDNIEVNSYKVDIETVNGKVYSDHFSITTQLTLRP